MRRINQAVGGRTAILLCLLCCTNQPLGSDLSSLSPQDDQRTYPSCRHCGMNRTQFAHSRVLITYADGTQVATCSIHCGALDLAVNLTKPFRQFQVGDFNDRKLVDAQTAHWVLGGRKPGVMSRRAKWAFESKEAADTFIREHGGELTDFSGALKAAYADMYDFVISRKKRPAGT